MACVAAYEGIPSGPGLGNWQLTALLKTDAPCHYRRFCMTQSTDCLLSCELLQPPRPVPALPEHLSPHRNSLQEYWHRIFLVLQRSLQQHHRHSLPWQSKAEIASNKTLPELLMWHAVPCRLQPHWRQPTSHADAFWSGGVSHANRGAGSSSASAHRGRESSGPMTSGSC